MFAVSGRVSTLQYLRIFFRTEQTLGPGGFIILESPSGFTFTDPCEALDLDPEYYATNPKASEVTLPLPNIIMQDGDSCRRSVFVGISRATVKMQNILEGGRLFGYKVRVRNADTHDASAQSSCPNCWRIFTADASNYLVDGSVDAVPFIAGNDTKSWGVSERAGGARKSMNITVDITDTLPHRMTNSVENVTVYFKQVIEAPLVTGKVRILLHMDSLGRRTTSCTWLPKVLPTPSSTSLSQM
jgi:hypothetical protein